MRVEVKICGVTSAQAADAAVRAGADYAGLVFHPKSPRALNPAQGAALAARLKGRLRVVALFADASDDMLEPVMRAVEPDFLQLHGNETPARAAAIRSRYNRPVIKALPIADAGDFAPVASYDEAVDIYLFDAKPPSSATRSGGHGLAFDWQLLNGRKFNRPWFLAGGLSPENVARAVSVSGAERVDVSSGVEIEPGVKSPQLIGAFVAAARNAPAITEAPA